MVEYTVWEEIFLLLVWKKILYFTAPSVMLGWKSIATFTQY